jgi:hypothetical protein
VHQGYLLMWMLLSEEGVMDFGDVLEYVERVVVNCAVPFLTRFCRLVMRVFDSRIFGDIKKNLNWMSKIVNLAMQRLHVQTHSQLRGRFGYSSYDTICFLKSLCVFF